MTPFCLDIIIAIYAKQLGVPLSLDAPAGVVTALEAVCQEVMRVCVEWNDAHCQAAWLELKPFLDQFTAPM